MKDSPTIDHVPRAGVGPETLVLVVAAICLVGLVWGIVDANWVLVATEIPAVLALLAVAAVARARAAGREAAVVASWIGVACALELWVATVVFDARGITLAVIVAASTAATGGLGAYYWLYRKLGQNEKSLT